MKQCSDCRRFFELSGYYTSGAGVPHKRCKRCAGARRALQLVEQKAGLYPVRVVEATEWKTTPPVVDWLAQQFALLPRFRS
jgi:hypothetical protein